MLEPGRLTSFKMVPDATRRDLTESPHILIEYRRHFSASRVQIISTSFGGEDGIWVFRGQENSRILVEPGEFTRVTNA
jgi:hypothetical protein